MEYLHQFFTGVLILLTALLGSGEEAQNVVNTEFEEAVVTRVIDGDTIDVIMEDRAERVRYIGVDTPEFNHDTGVVDCFANEALELNQTLVDGQSVILRRDIGGRDKYGRLLRYVYVGDTFVNQSLVRSGAGRAVYIEPDTTFYSELKDAESAAKEDHLGLWSVCY